jgi:hypothetical protein
VVVGDRSKDVIVHLHYIMSSMDIKNQNRSVLWAYKNKLLGFTRYVDQVLNGIIYCLLFQYFHSTWANFSFCQVTERNARPK